MEFLRVRAGDEVRVRQRTWIVRDVHSYETCQLLTLAALSPTGSSSALRVIHPFDDVEEARSIHASRRISLRAWRRACKAVLLEDGPSWALRTAISAGIELLAYQLEPALAVLRGLGSRILIADDVGLGKTVQAVLILAELLARGIVSRALIICPAGLREQWTEECSSRFNLDLAILDQTGLRRARARLPVGVNPWATVPLAIASVDFVKRPEVLPAALEANWDLVIVDEAHGACGQSDRRDAVSSLCRRAPHVLLLSATPHNGDEAAFKTLCNMGSNGDELVVFRRSRLEAGRDAGRRAHTLRVARTGPERRMHAALAALTRAVHREGAHLDRSVWLMLSLLHKRALSSPYALAASAERRLQMLGEPLQYGTEQLPLPWEDDGGELDAADAAPMWGTPALKDLRQERRLLEQLVDAARSASGCEGKLRCLHRLLRRVREPVIVFTEYRDTLQHVRTQVAPHAAVVHGGLSREQRRAALGAFPSTGVLLATDAAGEGLNLQQHCRFVINLELPWNPMRLEQRVGRVDRIGQKQRVHVCHLISAGTGEASLLDRLSSRVSQARARVGAPNPLVGRPEWTEESSARLIVLREKAPLDANAQWTAPPVPLTRLTREAALETERLGAMRGLVASGEPSGAGTTVRSATLVARTRRSRMRAALGGSSLAVVRASTSDGTGRVIATSVYGVRINSAGFRGVASGTHIGAICAAVQSVAASCHEESVRIHQAMTRRQLDRARAIAELFRAAISERQPGLFDRRAESEWREDEDARAEAAATALERVARTERALDVRRDSPVVSLVLLSGAEPRS
jgi:superfamily II DNA or RNA helicase